MRNILTHWKLLTMYQRPYWRFRAFKRNVSFRLKRSVFHTRNSLEEISTNARILWTLFRSVFRASILALALFGIIIGAKEFTSLPLLESVSSNNQDAYDGFLITIITVIGIFLTLYLTNLNTLVGTFYVEMPSKIRNLLVQEKVGNVYVSFLIFLTIFSLLLLGTGTLRDFRPEISIIIVAFLGCMAVLVFAQLSRRAFTFFDPTSFASILIGQLDKWSYQATIRGYSWHNASFQDFYRKHAKSAADGLVAISNICHEKQYLRQEALANLLAGISSLVIFYLPRKREIPHDSRWYELSPYYQRWYLADFAAVSVAASTKTGLQAEMKPDHKWLERSLMDIEIEALQKCRAGGRFHVIYQILTNLTNLFGVFGFEWEVEYAGQLLSEISGLNIFSQIEFTGDIEYEKKIYLACLDSLGLLPINLLLGFIKSLSGVNLEELSQRLEKVNWRNHESIYQLGFPAPTVYQLEYLCPRLQFEIETEHHLVSPHWYIRQLTFQAVAKTLRSQLDTLTALGAGFYFLQAQFLVESKQFLMATELTTRGLEFYNKAQRLLLILQNLATELDKSRVEKKIPWPQWDWEKERLKIRDAEKALMGIYAKCIPALAEIRDTEDTPDYFGQAVHLVGEEFFGAAIQNDVDFAAKLFGPYFLGILLTLDRLRERTTDWHIEDALLFSNEPILDLIELSGYAFIFAEYHQEIRLRKIIEQVWENYLAGDENFTRLDSLAAIVSYTRNFLAITSRSVLRVTWTQKTGHLFRQLPRKALPIDHSDMAFLDYSVVDHPSLLIRTVCGNSDFEMAFVSLRPMDIFIELYLKVKTPGRELDFGSRFSFSDEMERQKELEKEGEGALSQSGTHPGCQEDPTTNVIGDDENSDD